MDNQRWVTSRHPTQRRRKPYLTDNKDLGREFRKQYIRGLRRLIRSGKLRIEAEWSFLRDPVKREAWLDELEATAWNVFIEGPPHGQSRPEHVVKYLARYISGGPIADRRLISDQAGKVTFWARAKDNRQSSNRKSSMDPRSVNASQRGPNSQPHSHHRRKRYRMNKPEPFTLRGHEFVRRWSMHILPKGYTRSRSYGGYHGSKRKTYLARCQELLDVVPDSKEVAIQPPIEEPESSLPKCERCEIPMHCIAAADRPSWREIFEFTIYRKPVYSPMHHLSLGRRLAGHGVEGYG